MDGRLPRAASRVSRRRSFEIGQALYQAELGERHPSACAMRGLNAVEIVSDYRGDTYRGVYTTRLKGFIYVLHCFQKKSKAGIKTPKRDLELIWKAARRSRTALQSRRREEGVNEHAQKDTG